MFVKQIEFNWNFLKLRWMPKEHFGSSSGDQPTSRFFKSLLLQVVQLSHFLGEGEEDLWLDAAKSRTDAGRLWTSTKHCRPPTSLRQLQATHLIIHPKPFINCITFRHAHITALQHSTSQHSMTGTQSQFHTWTSKINKLGKLSQMEWTRQEPLEIDSIHLESHENYWQEKFWFNKVRIASGPKTFPNEITKGSRQAVKTVQPAMFYAYRVGMKHLRTLLRLWRA